MPAITDRVRQLAVCATLVIGGAGCMASEQNSGPAPTATRPDAGIPAEDLVLMARILDEITKEYIEPKGGHELLLSALRQMIGSLDRHSALIENVSPAALHDAVRGEFAGIGVELEIRDGVPQVVTAMQDSPALRAGLRGGDRIEAIDGESTRGRSLEDVIAAIKGPARSIVKLRIGRDDGATPRELALERQLVRFRSVDIPVGDGAPVVRVSEFLDMTPSELVDGLARQAPEQIALGLVLDLRGNPGGLVDAAVGLASLFLPPNQLVLTVHGRPGSRSQPHLSSEPYRVLGAAAQRARLVQVLRSVPLVVLIDGQTASSAEIVAAALQDHGRARIVGCGPSMGKGTIQSIVPLSQSYAIKLTTARYRTPKGHDLDGQGVAPDVTVSAGAGACELDRTLALAAARRELERMSHHADSRPAATTGGS